MELDFAFFAFAIPAVIFAGISKGGFGSGAAFVAAPLMALVVEPALALGIMLPLLMLIDLSVLRPYWGRWDLRGSWLVIAGGLPGVALGATLYQYASPDTFRILIGGISLAFVAWQLGQAWRKRRPERAPIGLAGGLVTGITAGFGSFISHAGGPPVAVYLLSRGFDKTTYQASSVLIFWAINIFKAVPYTFLGIFTWETLTVDLYLAPFTMIGVYIGVKAHWMLPERLFFSITYVLLVVTGSKLLWDGLT